MSTPNPWPLFISVSTHYTIRVTARDPETGRALTLDEVSIPEIAKQLREAAGILESD